MLQEQKRFSWIQCVKWGETVVIDNNSNNNKKNRGGVCKALTCPVFPPKISKKYNKIRV